MQGRLRNLGFVSLLVSVLASCSARSVAGESADADDATTSANDAKASADGSEGSDEATWDSGPIEDDDAGHDDGWTNAGEEGDCGGFLGCDDMPSSLLDCDFWTQDCPEGEKCTPAMTPYHGAWDLYVCVRAGYGTVGEACAMAEGHAWTDTCDAHSMCWDVDPNTGVGTCVGYCVGSVLKQTCPETTGVAARCQSFGGVTHLCLPDCNPLLAGECPDGQTCVASFESDQLQGFICFPPAAEGLSSEECACSNCCAAGHMCVEAAEYGPDCALDLCCTEYCDTEDPSFVCQGTDQVCVALFDPSTPEIGNVGRCGVP